MTFPSIVAQAAWRLTSRLLDLSTCVDSGPSAQADGWPEAHRSAFTRLPWVKTPENVAETE